MNSSERVDHADSAKKQLGIEKCKELLARMDPSVVERYYGSRLNANRRDLTSPDPLGVLLRLALSPAVPRLLKYPVCSSHEPFQSGSSTSEPHSILEMDAQVQRAFETFGRDFPTSVWTCCKARCFALTAALPEHFATFNAIFKIYRLAESFHEQLEKVDGLLPSRKRGIGGSSVIHHSLPRGARTADSGTERQKCLKNLKGFIERVLPFLRAESPAPDGTSPPIMPLCIKAICNLLGVQRSTLYRQGGGELCIVDKAGVRQRKFRRIGSRRGFSEIQQLQNFSCGCDVPCFSGISCDALSRLWDEFKSISCELSPEEKEHRYIMNQLFCPLTNTSVRVCNAAIAQLYTVSEQLISSLRMIVHQLCEDPALWDMPIREHGMKRYRVRHHPINRLPSALVEHVERHLDMVLRPDPAAAHGNNICRVYSPEVNTQEKLRRLISENISKDIDEVIISPSSLQRMITAYLKSRDCRISFAQSDHNACPMCKGYQYEILRLHYEEKKIAAKLSPFLQMPRPLQEEDDEAFERVAIPLLEQQNSRQCRIDEAIAELRVHNERDARIRGFLKRLIDHFRQQENYERSRAGSEFDALQRPFKWRQRPEMALLTHQDDMTKVDLPHTVVESSSDITRWRFDINAHVNAITGDAVIFSHEQGAGPKRASTLIETIILDHLMTCAGEGVKIIVSDNASVGKNWLSAVALPQYFVDQGLADIVLVVFLENNHGKWLADMIFGQFQIRKRNSLILSVDSLLEEFEKINRPSGGHIRGYALNPLASIDFSKRCSIF